MDQLGPVAGTGGGTLTGTSGILVGMMVRWAIGWDDGEVGNWLG